MSALRNLGLTLGCLITVCNAAQAQAPQSLAAALLASAERQDPVQAAYRQFERTGHARIVQPQQDGSFIVFPFGHARPTLRCPRLNACMIALEPGEEMTDRPLAGDTERWIISTSVTGSGERSVLVVIKPQSCDIATNLLIPTTRRVYELALASDPCKARGDSGAFTRQVKFWYPDQMRAQRQVELEAKASTPDVLSVVNRRYYVDRGSFLNRKGYPWIPNDVFDDGTRSFIVLPERARTGELPILYLLENGERHVLNYALRGDTIVADRVFERAVLVVGSGKGEKKVEIENRAVRQEEKP
jgi:type IV secretion system protein VirB9